MPVAICRVLFFFTPHLNSFFYIVLTEASAADPLEVKSEVADLRNVLWLSQKKFVHDIVPVGTSGIAYEARMMAFAVGRQLKLAESADVNLVKSAGPARMVLITMDHGKFEELASLIHKPAAIVGEIL